MSIKDVEEKGQKEGEEKQEKEEEETNFDWDG